MELIHRDEVNVAYILKLLATLQRQKRDENREEYDKNKQSIIDLLSKETQLRSKRELIEQFINEYMPRLQADADLDSEFNQFWNDSKQAAVKAFCRQENLSERAVMAMIEEYNFSGKPPLREAVFDALARKPKLMERKTIFNLLLDITALRARYERSRCYLAGSPQL